ncbi:hypothetical protein VTN96DRAFT_4153 [Rasamsonia emersonii]
MPIAPNMWRSFVDWLATGAWRLRVGWGILAFLSTSVGHFNEIPGYNLGLVIDLPISGPHCRDRVPGTTWLGTFLSPADFFLLTSLFFFRPFARLYNTLSPTAGSVVFSFTRFFSIILRFLLPTETLFSSSSFSQPFALHLICAILLFFFFFETLRQLIDVSMRESRF